MDMEVMVGMVVMVAQMGMAMVVVMEM